MIIRQPGAIASRWRYSIERLLLFVDPARRKNVLREDADAGTLLLPLSGLNKRTTSQRFGALRTNQDTSEGTRSSSSTTAPWYRRPSRRKAMLNFALVKKLWLIVRSSYRLRVAGAFAEIHLYGCGARSSSRRPSAANGRSCGQVVQSRSGSSTKITVARFIQDARASSAACSLSEPGGDRPLGQYP